MLMILALVAGLGSIMGVLVDVFVDGYRFLSLSFLTHYSSRFPTQAGIRAPLLGTFLILSITAALAFPVAVGAALYLEEFAPRNRITRALRSNIQNLAGVPSVIYGLVGLAIFVRALGFNRSVLVGALTLSLMVTPIITLAAMDALRRVPMDQRMAAFALGASRWQVVRTQVLPIALPGILSGGIRALARAAGEAAPLIFIGIVTFVAFTPQRLGDPFTALPLQVFDWISRGGDYRGLAAAASLVLLFMLLALNGLAALIRVRFGRRVR